MPALVHLADERDSSRILNGGLTFSKHRPGVYCMPVLPNFYVSHQWQRELKRRGIRTYVGVYFHMNADEMVYAGRYNETHRHISLGEAIAEIMSLNDPLGYELIIGRKIEPKEITGIKHLPQNIGWRYKPGSKGTKPCSCGFCSKGAIKGGRFMRKLEGKEV